MPSYEIKILFKTDRELTEDEKFLIAGHSQVQVEEPVDENGKDMNICVSEVNTTITRWDTMKFPIS